MVNKIKLIYDCDNTLGVPGKDVDDGLTLLYLLGRQDIELLGVTLSHGNADLDTVIACTRSMLDTLHITVPVYSRNDAVTFLLDSVNSTEDLTILATGSLINVYEANTVNPRFLSSIKELYIMGGITHPLMINGHQVDELNFATHPVAAEHVLNSEANICLLHGHVCSQAVFSKREALRLQQSEGVLYRYLEVPLKRWMKKMNETFDMEGFCNWDIAAAICISYRELFSNEYAYIVPTVDSLRTGNINVSDQGKKIYMPHTILDMQKFNNIIFESFERVNQQISNGL